MARLRVPGVQVSCGFESCLYIDPGFIVVIVLSQSFLIFRRTCQNHFGSISVKVILVFVSGKTPTALMEL